MNIITDFIKNKKIFVSIVIIIIVGLLSVLYLIGKRNINQNKNIPDNIALSPAQNWNKITPGKSTKEDVIKEFGDPISSTEDLLTYKSSSPARDNQITIQNNQVDLIKQMITSADKISTKSLTQKYGISSDMLYGPESPNGINLFVYANKGVAYLGNPLTEDVIEVWYFPPTILKDFKSKYAQGYSSTLSPSF